MKERFDNLDGLRAISCLCIIAMHIKANTEYSLHPFLTSIVSSWTHFVPLFLIISGFGMFCGYYNRFKNGEVNLNLFYTKRYKKLLPFFVTLIVIDLLINRSFSHVIEGITEATLVFGLLPNNQLDVIGVSWTLGVIFLFYMLFPFVVYLCWTKKRTLITLVISIVLCFFCSFYFFSEKFVIDDFSGKRNFLYCSPYFIAGGALYIYKDLFFSFIRRYRYVWLLLCICLSVGWYFIPSNIMIKNLILFTFWLTYAVSVKSFLLSNKVSKY